MSAPHVLVVATVCVDASQAGIVLSSRTCATLQAVDRLSPAKLTLVFVNSSLIPEKQLNKQLLEWRKADKLGRVTDIDIVLLTHADVSSPNAVGMVTSRIVQQVNQWAVSKQPITHIIASATVWGNTVLARVAALVDVSMLSNVTTIIDAHTFVRPIYEGRAWATLSSQAPLKVVTIGVRCTKQPTRLSDDPTLTSAHIVVAGGRGVQSAHTFKTLKTIAHLLGAALGGSSAAVDAGFISDDYKIGQTGNVIAPQVYLAVGISGAIQHVAGVNSSKLIIAINSDSDASIFNVADYGLIGDLSEILPVLEKKLQERRVL